MFVKVVHFSSAIKMPKAKVRLHQAAVMCGYRRSKHATEHKFALLAIEVFIVFVVSVSFTLLIQDVRTKKQTRFYMGKRCVFVHPGLHFLSSSGNPISPFFQGRHLSLQEKVLERPPECGGCGESVFLSEGGSLTHVCLCRIVRHHGKAGLVRAVFKPNLPGQAIGKKIRVFLYPSSI